MQYVRNIGNTAWTTWNSLNPATLSGAIDVIVVEQEDGSFVCSPFHVRFGKFSLLRPFEKKVEFKVNGVKQEYAMKLGEGGEAFFVFETTANIPESMQTSPLVSPASSPPLEPQRPSSSPMQDPEPLDLEPDSSKPRSSTVSRPPNAVLYPQPTVPQPGLLSPTTTSPLLGGGRPKSGDWSSILRPHSDMNVPKVSQTSADDSDASPGPTRSQSPPPLSRKDAVQRAMALSRELSAVNIPSHVTETGDLKLDMTGFKSNDEDALRAELLARKILSEELDGNYDIGALFGVDEEGSLWIYSSEEAKDTAMKSMAAQSGSLMNDAASDPGYQSDSSVNSNVTPDPHRRAESDMGMDVQTPPSSPEAPAKTTETRSFAKTLRLTSEQLQLLDLKEGENSMSFTVNRSTCQANMYLWKHATPVVISDIDGTITKSDAMGHVMNMIGRDWTHAGVAKLYSDIAANGYNIMYLTSRSVGQSDNTRAYLHGIQQGGYKLPRGPTILSPDRTMAALRREIYLRKPHVFKMATLRDIRSLYGPDRTPFYAGFGNRLTDQISYRTVDVPSYRIFTINSNAEVSLDLLSLNKLKLSYVNMSDIVDHYFPPVSALITTKGGGDEFTDFKYWRDDPLALEEFSASESEEDEEIRRHDAVDEDEEGSMYGEEDEDTNYDARLADSYISRNSEDDEGEYYAAEGGHESMLSSSMMQEGYGDDHYADDEEEEEQDEDDDGDDDYDGDEGEEEEKKEADPPKNGLEGDLDKAEEEVRGGRESGEILGKVVGTTTSNTTPSTATTSTGTSTSPQLNATKQETPPPNATPKVAVEDVDAEIMTGMKELAITKDQPGSEGNA